MNQHLKEAAESLGLDMPHRQHTTPVTYEDVAPEMNEIFELEYDADDDDVTDLDGLTSTAFAASKASKAAKIIADKNAKESEKQRLAQNRVIERENAAAEKRMEKMRKDAEKAAKKKPASAPAPPRRIADDDTDSVFGDIATPIIGTERRVLELKISQYKQLFRDNAQIKKFKVKRNATTTDLEDAIKEMDSIVSLSTVDEFVIDAVIASIKVVEGITARTERYNVTGLADMLKTNPEFLNLIRLCAVKYNTFSAIPPEYQLVFIVATSAYICCSKNANKAAINAYLNQPVGSVYEPPVIAESKETPA